MAIVWSAGVVSREETFKHRTILVYHRILRKWVGLAIDEDVEQQNEGMQSTDSFSFTLPRKWFFSIKSCELIRTWYLLHWSKSRWATTSTYLTESLQSKWRTFVEIKKGYKTRQEQIKGLCKKKKNRQSSKSIYKSGKGQKSEQQEPALTTGMYILWHKSQHMFSYDDKPLHFIYTS